MIRNLFQVNKSLHFGGFIIGLISTVAMLYAAHCGLGVTYDSRNYLAAAQSLAESGTLLAASGEPYVAQPPLYPMVLFLLKTASCSAACFNALCWVFSLLLIWTIVVNTLSVAWVRLLAFGCISMSTSMFLIHQFLWSEPLFLTLFLLITVLTLNYVQTGKVRWLVAVCIAAVLLCMQRNAGIFLVAGLGTALLVLRPERKTFAAVVLTFLPAIAAFGWWNFGKFFGPAPAVANTPFFTAVPHNAYHYLVSVGVWVAPGVLPDILLLAAGLAVLLVFAQVLAVAGKVGHTLRLMATVTLVYLLALVLAHETAAEDFERYLAIVQPFGFTMIFAGLERCLAAMGWKKPMVIFMILLSAYTVVRSAKNLRFWHEVRCENGSFAE